MREGKEAVVMASSEIIVGDVREVLPRLAEASVHCVVTSPPYWGLRDYGVGGQLGLEATPEEFISNMVGVFREVRRVLRPDGTLWLNMGDGYNAAKTRGTFGDQSDHGYEPHGNDRPLAPDLKPKDLLGMPWRLALALQADGWWLRSDIVWSKPNPMPESVTDRPTKAHEYVFLLTKAARYFYDADAVKLPPSGISGGAVFGGKDKGRALMGDGHTRVGRNCTKADRDRYAASGANLRDVWQIPTQAYPEAHFATFPERLVVPCVKAGTSLKGCCPECGAPWERVVEMTEAYRALLESGKAWRTSEGKPDKYTNRQEKGHVSQVPDKNRTIGWRPGCGCGKEPTPCLVLDPFAGSGTVGVVSKWLGRSFIGSELNPQYSEMARRRIAGAGTSEPQEQNDPDQMSLFGDP